MDRTELEKLITYNNLDSLLTSQNEKLIATLYLANLQDVHTFFTDRLKNNAVDPNSPTGGLGAEGYKKVGVALSGPEVMASLNKRLAPLARAALLKYYRQKKGLMIPPADEPDLLKAQLRSFEQDIPTFFDDEIFVGTFQITGFYQQYPRLKYALDKITETFKIFIREACLNIIRDWNDIKSMFFQEVRIKELKAIEGTGSDAHKGGKQVLILTFKTLQKARQEPKAKINIKKYGNLIYKPSDLEIQTLLVGDTTALVQIDPTWNQKSLLEILNEKIAEKGSDTDLLPLPTFKVLPRERGSALALEDNRLPVEKPYGYLEFLHHAQGKNRKVYRDPKFGLGDFIIPENDGDQRAEKFYRQLGQIMALSSTFGLHDLHRENMIVSQFQPYLIDLEISLLYPVENLSQAGFFIRRAENMALVTGTAIPEGQTLGAETNRIYKKQGSSVALVPPLVVELIQGFRQMMNLLREENTQIVTWFDRLNNVLVRVHPIDTRRHTIVLKHLYHENAERNTTDQLVADLDPKLRNFEQIAFRQWLRESYKNIMGVNINEDNMNEEIDNMILQLLNNEKSWDGVTVPHPRFLSVLKDLLKPDYEQLDVPYFLHRIGSKYIIHSSGEEVKAVARDYVPAEHIENYKEVLTEDENPSFDHYLPYDHPTNTLIRDRKYLALRTQAGFFEQRVGALQAEIQQNLASGNAAGSVANVTGANT